MKVKIKENGKPNPYFEATNPPNETVLVEDGVRICWIMHNSNTLSIGTDKIYQVKGDTGGWIIIKMEVQE